MKKRVLSLLLCVVLLLSSAVVLSSCKKNNDGPKVSRKVVDVSLAGYTVITGVELTEATGKHVFSFTQGVSKLIGIDMGVLEDTEVDIVEDETPEILIGQTSRKESQDTLDSIKDMGWAIRVFPKTNKIAIVGTTPYLTRVALSYFERTYLNAEHANGKILSVNQKVMASKMETLSLVDTVDGEDVPFTVVRDNLAVNYKQGSLPQADAESGGTNFFDYPVALQTAIVNSLQEKTGVPVPTTVSNSEVVEKEILVGNMERPEMKEEIGKIDANEIALTIRDGKILLVAWSDDALQGTKELFEDMLLGSAIEDEEGDVIYQIPNNCTLVQCYTTQWVTDFPRPTGENIYPHGAVHVDNNYLQYIYAGSGVNREAFVAYCETLKAAGYTALGNEDVQWEGSSFRTFINNEKGISLHVSHMAFTHGSMLNSIRIVAGSVNNGWETLPDAQYFRPQVAGTEEQVKNGEADYVKRMNSRVTSIQIRPANGWGLGQIITLADGSLIVIDGGRTGDNAPAEFFQVMRELHREAHGEYPTKENPLHIRAWLITHGHGDHMNMVYDFCVLYGNDPAVRFDYLMYNKPSQMQLFNCGSIGLSLDRFQTMKDAMKNDFKYVAVQTGQVFYFANCRFEILYTLDDLYPRRMDFRNNNVSTISRTVLTESDDQGNTHESGCLWTGDLEPHGSGVIMALLGDFLQSEQVSVSHHGGTNTASAAFYSLIKPAVVWFPSTESASALGNVLFSGTSPYSSLGTHGDCRMVIFNMTRSEIEKKPYATLIMTATGPAYDRVYDANTKEPIEAKGELGTVVDVYKYFGKTE